MFLLLKSENGMGLFSLLKKIIRFCSLLEAVQSILHSFYGFVRVFLLIIHQKGELKFFENIFEQKHTPKELRFTLSAFSLPNLHLYSLVGSSV